LIGDAGVWAIAPERDWGCQSRQWILFRLEPDLVHPACLPESAVVRPRSSLGGGARPDNVAGFCAVVQVVGRDELMLGICPFVAVK
jgi:hypothetical protein